MQFLKNKFSNTCFSAYYCRVKEIISQILFVCFEVIFNCSFKKKLYKKYNLNIIKHKFLTNKKCLSEV